MKTINCPFCGNLNYSLVRESKDFDFFPDQIFSYVKCSNCSLVYLNPRPKPEDMINYYPDDYYAVPPDTFYEFARFNAPLYISKKQKPGRILDIGSNKGLFLKSMEKLGWEVYGSELSPFACKYAKDILELNNISCGDFESIEYQNSFFDAITLWNVIEHLNNPFTVLKKAYAILKPGGKIYINTQNYSSFLSRLFGKYWYQLDAPRHLYQFTPKTLKKALLDSGFNASTISSCEPFYTMVSAKVSFKRFIGKSNKVSKSKDKNGNPIYIKPKRNIIWQASRGILNFTLTCISILLVFLKFGDTMLVTGTKK